MIYINIIIYKIMLNFCDDIDIPPININDLHNIVNDNIPNGIYDSHMMTKFLHILCDKNNMVIEEFKKIMVEMLDMVIDMSNNHLLISCRKKILDEINKNPKNIIDTFIIDAYIKDHGLYRKEMIMGNESFFLNTECKTDNSDTLNYIFQSKNFWNNLDNDNKIILKTYLITLCCYSDKRFILFNIFQKLKVKYTQFGMILNQYNDVL